ncbi:trans-sulfuration enzyme family protein [Opitutus terrae]|nr:PLP-dependent aspartate aminotransferase family protein [Opitutus terrae]
MNHHDSWLEQAAGNPASDPRHEPSPPRRQRNASYQLATRCARAGSGPREAGRNASVQPAIHQSAIFDLGAPEDAEAIFSGARKGYAYSRFGNPTVDALARSLADLEGGHGAVVTSSGNAAVLCAVTAALQGRQGPLVTHPDIYGGSFELLRILADVYRVPVEFVDPADEDQWFRALERAGAVLVETPSNPLLRLIDLAAIVQHAKVGGAEVIVDNTVATPFNQRPFQFGADWVVHSTTKYLNGHGDLIGGGVIRREPFTASHRSIHKNLGGTVNAFDAWLVMRGLRTFTLRMEAHNRSGEIVARWLEQRPEISRVYHPSLDSHPQRELFGRQMSHGGGLLSFELRGGEPAAIRFLSRMQLIVHAVSLGGPETLATMPARSSHRGMAPDARQRAGVRDGLVRLSVGLEHVDDILADLDHALRAET